MLRRASLLLVILACSCGGEPAFDRNAMLRSLADTVIVPSYATLAARATTLDTATSAFCAAPNATTLDAVQAAWTDARGALVRTQAFSFGPYMAMPDPHEPALDFWPARTELAQSVLSAPGDVGALSNAQKGFPVAEWLLFDPVNGDGAVLTAFTDVSAGAKRCMYLGVIMDEIVTRSAALSAAWSGPDGYANELANAGGTSEVYPLTRLALADVLERVVFSLEDMRDMKVGAPLGLLSDGLGHPELVESPFAQRSNAALLEVVDSVEAIYSGDYDGVDGVGLGDFLVARNPALDATVKSQIDALRTAILALDVPLDVAVLSKRDDVMQLHEAVRTLHRTFGVDVSGALAVTISFNDADGD